MELILAPEGGDAPLDHHIAFLQGKIKDAPSSAKGALVEALGWTFVSKARLSNDPGYYKLAEQCALWLQGASPKDRSGLLLKGHILDAMHRFHEAEETARMLVSKWPNAWESHALLGDALMEQGKLNAAIDAYQRMVDLRPCSQSYLRIGHVRWLRGDLPGAMEMARLAVEEGGPLDPEPAAWAYTRLALYQFQAKDLKEANWSVDRAMQFVPQYAPALLLRGRMLLSQGKSMEAVAALKMAASENPLPEYRWTLADAQRAARMPADAEATEAGLSQRGAIDDPRTFSLFLSTRRERADTALHLAEAELGTRQDIFTQDAVAWAALAEGKVGDARRRIQSALAEGTQDARLYLHAGTIAGAAGDEVQAAEYLQKAAAIQQMLLPSERDLLARGLAEISKNQSTMNQQVPSGHQQ